MVLARNTYRLGLLLIGYAIAQGIDTIGGYGVEGLAGLGFGIGALGLFGGTLAHLARGPSDGGRSGTDTTADGGDGGDDDSEGDEDTVDRTVPLRYGW